MVSLAVNVCPPESQSDRSNVKVSPAWSPSVTDTVSSVSDTVDACQDGYMFASHASTSLFCLSEQCLLYLKLLYDIFLCRVNQ